MGGISVFETKTHFAALLKKVSQGVITKRGILIARIMLIERENIPPQKEDLAAEFQLLRKSINWARAFFHAIRPNVQRPRPFR